MLCTDVCPQDLEKRFWFWFDGGPPAARNFCTGFGVLSPSTSRGRGNQNRAGTRPYTLTPPSLPPLSRRTRRQLAAVLNKDGQFGFSAEAVEEPADLETAMAYYQLDDAEAILPPLAVRKQRHESTWVSEMTQSPPSQGAAVIPPSAIAPPPAPTGSYRLQRAPGLLPPAPAPGNTPVCSSEDDQEDSSTMEDQGEALTHIDPNLTCDLTCDLTCNGMHCVS